ncbi:MAG: hypothetical protein ACP5P3_06580 [Ignavibacteria bacterium]
MQIFSDKTSIVFYLKDFIKILFQVCVVAGTAIALFYNLQNEFNLLKQEVIYLRKDVNDMKVELRTHIDRYNNEFKR